MTVKKTVLITGCSQGSLGEALAFAFNKRGLRVLAAARNPSKMAKLEEKGIETVTLDVLSEESIAQCVADVSNMTDGRLDILVNNAGSSYAMPVIDASLEASRQLFNLNVFSFLAMTKAFLPMILKSENSGMIINQTSISSVSTVPMTGLYNASKAAAAALTENLRLELAPFKIKVIDLKTGAVHSGLYDDQNQGDKLKLPDDSIYAVARAEVEQAMTGDAFKKDMMPAQKWADQVAGDVLAQNPGLRIWRGGNAWLMWVARGFMPFTFLDTTMAKVGALDVVEKKLAKLPKKS